jgi:hypothetical protein
MNPLSGEPGREIFTLEAIVQSIYDFEKLIQERNKSLRLPPGSPIETASLAALQMLETFSRDLPQDTKQDYRREWCQAVALGEMLRKVMNVANHPFFDRLWSHVQLLLGDSNIALNVWNPKEDSGANKVFELYVALVLAPICTDLDLDHPVHSSAGKNPDVIAQLDGERWAFACKVMHTDSYETFIGRVKEGIGQIQCSNAEKGLVVISLKNQLPHEHCWAIKRQLGIADIISPGTVDLAIVACHIQEIAARYHRRVIDELLGGPSAFNDLFNNTRAVPAVLLHFCTTIFISNEGKPNFCLVRMFSLLNTNPISAKLLATLDSLNDSLHGRVPTKFLRRS